MHILGKKMINMRHGKQAMYVPSITMVRLHQTTSYNHLRLLLHLHSSSKEKQNQQQARNPLSRGGGGGGVEKPEGPSALQPTTGINIIDPRGTNPVFIVIF